MSTNPNGNPAEEPQLPDSIRTFVILGGQKYALDEEVEDVVRVLEAAVLGNQGSVQFHAGHLPIFFSREMFKTWASAWPLRRIPVASVHQLPTGQRESARR